MVENERERGRGGRIHAKMKVWGEGRGGILASINCVE